MLTIAKATAIGTALEVLLYGVYLCTSVQHARLLTEKRRSTSTSTFVYMSWTSACLFMLTTTAVCSDIAFLAHMTSEETGPTIDFTGYNLKHIINVTCTLVAVAVSDAFLVYRSFILWRPNYWLLILPFAVFGGELGLLGWSLYHEFMVDHSLQALETDVPRLTHAQVGFGAACFAINLICTALISARLWRSHRGSGRVTVPDHSRRVLRVGAIIIESAAVNLLWLAGMFFSSLSSSAVYPLMADMYAPVTAIIFSTIVVRSTNRSDSQRTSVSVNFSGLRHVSMSAVHPARTRDDRECYDRDNYGIEREDSVVELNLDSPTVFSPTSGQMGKTFSFSGSMA
ncbi:hypothetical protein BD626DRAFT_583320 [Schizophyllum amplum]|uniref:Uncharacterized protein n=1 Tax=Schizophyllum amplum TaxID=97359 RepID=A0A550CH77_9AGAR|nr:hypothetical protein BD626DRAFT_583320 [Auriculariopsis ampla]